MPSRLGAIRSRLCMSKWGSWWLVGNPPGCSALHLTDGAALRKAHTRTPVQDSRVSRGEALLQSHTARWWRAQGESLYLLPWSGDCSVLVRRKAGLGHLWGWWPCSQLPISLGSDPTNGAQSTPLGSLKAPRWWQCGCLTSEQGGDELSSLCTFSGLSSPGCEGSLSNG